MINRQTLRSAVSLDGLGLHSGVPVRVTIHPGNQGIRFHHETTIIDATPENVSDTRRCTKLGHISTVEHLMSAFAGCQVSDADVELTAPELPGLDGSALEYVNAMRKAGFEDLGESEKSELFARIFLQEDSIKIGISKGSGHWGYTYDVGERWPHEMHADVLDVVKGYEQGIAPARTFALSEEVPAVLAAGLGKGLKEDEVLILGDRGFENVPRFSNEPALHKLLDLIGDLYLSGYPIRDLNVNAQRSGHRTNVAAAMKLKEATRR